MVLWEPLYTFIRKTAALGRHDRPTVRSKLRGAGLGMRLVLQLAIEERILYKPVLDTKDQETTRVIWAITALFMVKEVSTQALSVIDQ